ncbi:MAG: hypothetical protein JJU27_03415 [Gammaproteobacteria bacterium]|nr:hypothetical protein [Gammaproteobacteria bacterium]
MNERPTAGQPADDALLRRARTLFREQEAKLAPEVRSALAAARQTAMEEAATPRRSLRRAQVLGPALAAALVLAIWVWPQSPDTPPLPMDTSLAAELDLLISAEDWELIEQLDFYLLLSELDEDFDASVG